MGQAAEKVTGTCPAEGLEVGSGEESRLSSGL